MDLTTTTTIEFAFEMCIHYDNVKVFQQLLDWCLNHNTELLKSARARTYIITYGTKEQVEQLKRTVAVICSSKIQNIDMLADPNLTYLDFKTIKQDRRYNKTGYNTRLLANRIICGLHIPEPILTNIYKTTTCKILKRTIDNKERLDADRIRFKKSIDEYNGLISA